MDALRVSHGSSLVSQHRQGARECVLLSKRASEL
jgi:hypothetical protein